MQAVLDEDFYEELEHAISGTDPGLTELMADTTEMELVHSPTPPAATEPAAEAMPQPPPAPTETGGNLGAAARRVWTRLRELFAQVPRP